MQVVLKDLRQYGYVKLYNSYPSDLIQKIRDLNTEAYDKHPKAYSFLKDWVYMDVSWYRGMESFVTSCEPLINSIDLSSNRQDSASIKRKFRDRYDNVWKLVEISLNLNRSDTKVLSDFGLKLAYLNPRSIAPEVIEFYNTMLGWSSVTNQESSLEAYGLSCNNLLDHLIFDSSDVFKVTILEEWL